MLQYHPHALLQLCHWILLQLCPWTQLVFRRSQQELVVGISGQSPHNDWVLCQPWWRIKTIPPVGDIDHSLLGSIRQQPPMSFQAVIRDAHICGCRVKCPWGNLMHLCYFQLKNKLQDFLCSICFKFFPLANADVFLHIPVLQSSLSCFHWPMELLPSTLYK